jgi:hypothetical protein
MAQDVLPQKGQRWRKKGTKTSEVLVTEFYEGNGPPVPFGPSVFVEAGFWLKTIPLDDFLSEYEGPLPEPEVHDERVEYVPLLDPPDERAWEGKRRLKVRIEGRGANRAVTIEQETCYSGDRWTVHDNSGYLYLAPDEARLLVAALAKVLQWEGDADA